ncbi:MAG: DUF3606 domain-containing protein, partial [Xanthobacteraceae bacterium]
YWSKKFKVTPAKLKSAVKKVGHSARKVEAYIKFQRHISRDEIGSDLKLLTLIALSQPYEVRYWSVKAAGHSSKKVSAYLAKNRKTKRKRAKSR